MSYTLGAVYPMKDGLTCFSSEQAIGTLNLNVYPYAEQEEERKGTCTTIQHDGMEDEQKTEEEITEVVHVVHTITWTDDKPYPTQIALVSSYPGDYYEIGEVKDNSWQSVGYLSPNEDWEGSFMIMWDEAHNHLPAIKVSYPLPILVERDVKRVRSILKKAVLDMPEEMRMEYTSALYEGISTMNWQV